MNGRGRGGLDSGGMIRPYGGSRNCNHSLREIDTTRAVISRPKSLRSARARMGHAKAVSMLIVCATAVIIASAIVLASVGKGDASVPMTSGNAQEIHPAPGTPFLVFGIIYDGGGSPVPGATVTITNNRTGEFNTYVSEFDGYYEYDMQIETTSGILPGDDIYVEVVKDTFYGFDNATIPTPAGPYLIIDVTMSDTEIPEFPMAIVPVIGMLALFAVVRLNRRGEEQ